MRGGEIDEKGRGRPKMQVIIPPDNPFPITRFRGKNDACPSPTDRSKFFDLKTWAGLIVLLSIELVAHWLRNANHRGRIRTEEKAKVVADVWGTEWFLALGRFEE